MRGLSTLSGSEESNQPYVFTRNDPLMKSPQNLLSPPLAHLPPLLLAQTDHCLELENQILECVGEEKSIDPVLDDFKDRGTPSR